MTISNKSPKSLMGKLEVVALFVGIEGLHYESIDGEWCNVMDLFSSNT